MDTTTNYGLKKPAYEDGADVKTFNDNADIVDTELKKAENHRADKNNPHGVTAEQVGALPDTTAALKNPAALTLAHSYEGSTGTYDGSMAKTMSVPYVTFHTSAPTGVLGDGEIYCVYE